MSFRTMICLEKLQKNSVNTIQPNNRGSKQKAEKAELTTRMALRGLAFLTISMTSVVLVDGETFRVRFLKSTCLHHSRYLFVRFL